MSRLSVVSPVYNSEGCLAELYRRLVSSLEKITTDFEIILVEDCGHDRSWQIIEELAQRDGRVKGIKLSRNFGQHYAISAGLDHAAGDWVVVMDCDLQDQPEEIEKLYRRTQEGYDVVLAIRQERQDGALSVWAGRFFYRVLEYLTGATWDSRIGAFRIMSRKVVENFRQMREQLRYFGGMVQWLGFSTAFQEVVHAPRYAGQSAYNFRKSFTLALDAILSFSERPLYFSVFLGLVMSAGSLACGMYIVVRKFLHGIPVEGWTSLIVSLYFLAGLILMNLGILGLYMGRIFLQTKNRPLYVIAEKIGL
jgi:dolichol-phosphate mannosyltransferase